MTRNISVRPLGLGMLVAPLLILARPAHAVTFEWARQLGTASSDGSFAVSADGRGDVYISGWTSGNLGGPNVGGRDAFVSKYDAAGALKWTRQLGTAGGSEAVGVSADRLGNVYISGWTGGNLGGPNAGAKDAFVSKYDAIGALQWTRQLGTVSRDESFGVSADSLGSVYISGHFRGRVDLINSGIEDAFVSKYDAVGGLQWTQQIATASYDYSLGVSADSLGNVYISGYTGGSIAGPNQGRDDAFISKYNAAGVVQWTRQIGSSGDDIGFGVSADGLGNVYIAGRTDGSLGESNAGGSDAFVRKYDAAGVLQWTRQMGTVSYEFCLGVSADGSGNVYISGYTGGSLGGPNAGTHDAFVSKYDAAGALQWTRQIGTASVDASYGVSADALGNVYISGITFGSLGGANAGENDAFVVKYSDPMVPETASLNLLLVGITTLLADGRRLKLSRGRIK